MILNINKPLGMTSYDVVAFVKRLTGEKKVGHAGTLDPMASGVLLVAVGRESTKQIDQLMSGYKEYVAEVILGVETDTLDREGQIIDSKPVPDLTPEQIDKALLKFIGTTLQYPPIYSAVHHHGERAYDLARQGKEVKLAPRYITIMKIEVLKYPHEDQGAELPKLTIRVTCEKGTYIRSLAKDIGSELGTCAFLGALVRTKIGAYHVETSSSLEHLTLAMAGLFTDPVPLGSVQHKPA
ncbi:MAG: tRNA pseudouridine(55) synthase TruB [Candidatus Margulisiibacteriota bacterium]|jgi:tRNA pseudouridine55 synthase